MEEPPSPNAQLYIDALDEAFVKETGCPAQAEGGLVNEAIGVTGADIDTSEISSRPKSSPFCELAAEVFSALITIDAVVLAPALHVVPVGLQVYSDATGVTVATLTPLM